MTVSMEAKIKNGLIFRLFCDCVLNFVCKGTADLSPEEISILLTL